MTRVLALDYGSRRIGVALSDETKKIAFAKPFIEYSNKNEIIKLIQDNQVEEIILGLPKNLRGEETAAAAAARKFGDWLEEQTNTKVQYIDERFTTKEILERDKGDKGYRGDRGVVDSLVAQKMLQNYLEHV